MKSVPVKPEFIKKINELDKLIWLSSDTEDIQIDPFMESTGFGSYQMFFFDPNKIGFDEWEKMGVPEIVAQRIEQYKSRGGKIRKAEDLLRFSGYNSEWYDRVKDYVRIEDIQIFNSQKQPTTTNLLFDLNTVSKEELIAIKGIGNVLSERIINYRNALGGYFKIEQLAEVYGIDSMKYLYLKKFFFVNHPKLKKISLNLSEPEQLASHPYISYQQAKKIIDFRNKTGGFKSLDQLREAGIFSDTNVLKKLLPYLCIWEDD